MEAGGALKCSSLTPALKAGKTAGASPAYIDACLPQVRQPGSHCCDHAGTPSPCTHRRKGWHGLKSLLGKEVDRSVLRVTGGNLAQAPALQREPRRHGGDRLRRPEPSGGGGRQGRLASLERACLGRCMIVQASALLSPSGLHNAPMQWCWGRLTCPRRSPAAQLGTLRTRGRPAQPGTACTQDQPARCQVATLLS